MSSVDGTPVRREFMTLTSIYFKTKINQPSKGEITIKLSRQYENKYVFNLPKDLQKQIMTEVKAELSALGFTEEEYEEAVKNAENEKSVQSDRHD